MEPSPFTYHRPESLSEALSLLATLGDDAKVLAGGQSLIPTLALRLSTPSHIVDIGRLPGLDTIRVDGDGNVAIGALVRHAQAEHSDDVAARVPLLAQALPHIGHRAIRNRGTVVGSITHADPAAELPAVALAAGAKVVAASVDGSREILAAELFTGYLSTSLRSDELVTEVIFPSSPATTRSALVEVARRHGDFAMVGLACLLDVIDGNIADAALAFFGVAATPLRVAAVEQMLIGRPPSAKAFDEVATAVQAAISPTADVHASANYRRHVAAVLTRRGLEQAATTGVPA